MQICHGNTKPYILLLDYMTRPDYIQSEQQLSESNMIQNNAMTRNEMFRVCRSHYREIVSGKT